MGKTADLPPSSSKKRTKTRNLLSQYIAFSLSVVSRLLAVVLNGQIHFLS